MDPSAPLFLITHYPEDEIIFIINWYILLPQHWKCLSFQKTSKNKGRWQRWKIFVNNTCLCSSPVGFFLCAVVFRVKGKVVVVGDTGSRLERLQPPSRWLGPLQYAWTQERAIKDIIYRPVTRGLSNGLLLFRCATISRIHVIIPQWLWYT